MLLIDDLLGLPITGFKFVLRTLQQVAEEQYTDSGPVKEWLLELQMQLEAGDITEQEYNEEEAEIFRQLREIENRKREMAAAPREESGVQKVGSASVSADLSYGQRHDRRERK